MDNPQSSLMFLYFPSYPDLWYVWVCHVYVYIIYNYIHLIDFVYIHPSMYLTTYLYLSISICFPTHKYLYILHIYIHNNIIIYSYTITYIYICIYINITYAYVCIYTYILERYMQNFCTFTGHVSLLQVQVSPWFPAWRRLRLTPAPASCRPSSACSWSSKRGWSRWLGATMGWAMKKIPISYGIS